jgi:hypothetical protein
MNHIGKTIHVYWVDDEEWYPGVVEDYQPGRGWYVQYNDGDHEWLRSLDKNVTIDDEIGLNSTFNGTNELEIIPASTSGKDDYELSDDDELEVVKEKGKIEPSKNKKDGYDEEEEEESPAPHKPAAPQYVNPKANRERENDNERLSPRPITAATKPPPETSYQSQNLYDSETGDSDPDIEYGQTYDSPKKGTTISTSNNNTKTGALLREIDGESEEDEIEAYMNRHKKKEEDDPLDDYPEERSQSIAAGSGNNVSNGNNGNSGSEAQYHLRYGGDRFAGGESTVRTRQRAFEDNNLEDNPIQTGGNRNRGGEIPGRKDVHIFRDTDDDGDLVLNPASNRSRRPLEDIDIDDDGGYHVEDTSGLPHRGVLLIGSVYGASELPAPERGESDGRCFFRVLFVEGGAKSTMFRCKTPIFNSDVADNLLNPRWNNDEGSFRFEMVMPKSGSGSNQNNHNRGSLEKAGVSGFYLHGEILVAMYRLRENGT